MASRTLAVLDYQLRQAVRDYSVSDPAFPLPERLYAMERAMYALEGKLPSTPTLSTSFLTLSAGTYSYTSATDLQGVSALRRQSDGGKVYRITPQLGLELRKGQTISSGDPEAIWFEESAAGVLTAYLYPTPSKADVLDAFREAGPTSFAAQSISASADLSLVSLSMGVYAHEAFLHRAAYELTYRAPAEKLDKLGLAPDAAQGFLACFSEALDAESERVLKLRRPSGLIRRGIR